MSRDRFSRPVFFEANRLKQLETSQSEGTALRLWHNGRPGLTVAYGAVDPQVMVERTFALSQLNQLEPVELSSNSCTSYPDLGEVVAVERLIDWGKRRSPKFGKSTLMFSVAVTGSAIVKRLD